MKNIAYLLALHSIDGLGPIRLKALIDYFKDPKLAWEADGKKLTEIGIALDDKPDSTAWKKTKK